MLPAPCLHALHMFFAFEVARVLEAPLSLARVFAGQLAFRLAAVPLVPDISRVRLVPTAAVTTLSQTCCAHRLPPPCETGKNTIRHAILTA
jgi:hypothetical protein